MDNTDIVEPSYVTVVNRLPDERVFMGWGREHRFKGHEERALSLPFAQWVFTRTDGPMLAHTDQGYIHWLGIKAGPDELVAILPETAFDTTPLQPVESIEGWNYGVADRDPDKTKVLKVAVQRADFDNQGGTVGRGTMGAPRRVTKE